MLYIKKNDISIVEGNDNLIQSYGLIKDIFNNNSFMLKLNITRYIYFAAKENIKFFSICYIYFRYFYECTSYKNFK